MTVTEAISARAEEVGIRIRLLEERRAGLIEALDLARAALGEAKAAQVEQVEPAPKAGKAPALPEPKRKRAPRKKAEPSARPTTKRSQAKAPPPRQAKRGATRDAILAVFRARPSSTHTAVQVFKALGQARGRSVENVRMGIKRLVQAGELNKVDAGLYQLAGVAR